MRHRREPSPHPTCARRSSARTSTPWREDRYRSAIAVFLKAHGTAQAPLADHWLDAGGALVRERRTAFPRRPRMSPGDRLILYASGWRRIFGIAEVVGEPDRRGSPMDPVRWPWSVEVELLVVVPVLSNAPPVEAIGVAARSMSQHSHIRLDFRHLALAAEALGSVGR